MSEFNNSEKKLSIKASIFWILFSIIIICGPTTVGLYYLKGVKVIQSRDSQYNIVAIVQTGPEKEQLKTTLLAELLDLSVDHPTNLHQLNIDISKQKLLNFPLIKTAEIKKIKPGTIYIDYAIRTPIAFSADLKNTAIDSEGYLIPFKPFFAPKKLPDIYLGSLSEDVLKWGTKIDSLRMNFALKLFDYLNLKFLSKNLYLKRIDVSKLEAPSYGQREIIVMLEEWKEMESDNTLTLNCYPIILRINPNFYEAALKNYLQIRSVLFNKISKIAKIENQLVTFEPVVIDLRIQHLSYISGL